MNKSTPAELGTTPTFDAILDAAINNLLDDLIEVGQAIEDAEHVHKDAERWDGQQ